MTANEALGHYVHDKATEHDTSANDRPAFEIDITQEMVEAIARGDVPSLVSYAPLYGHTFGLRFDRVEDFSDFAASVVKEGQDRLPL